MNYQAHNISTFSQILLLRLSWRVQEFAVYIKEQQIKNPEMCSVKSRNEWLEEYLEWSKRQNENT